MAKCTKCGAKAGFMMSLCDVCYEKTEVERKIRASMDDSEIIEAREEQDRQIKSIVLTTAPSLEGFRILETLEIVTSECVFGINIFRDMFAALSDVFGGRSETSQRALREARQTCLWELRKEAHQIGANAVIAVDLDYSEFSGGGKSMLFLVASGTAVRVERL